MVRTVQAHRTAARRDRAGKGRRDQGCESKRGRKPESFFQIQHPRDSIASVFQEWPAPRPGDRNDKQEGFAHPAGSTGLTKILLDIIGRRNETCCLSDWRTWFRSRYFTE